MRRQRFPVHNQEDNFARSIRQKKVRIEVISLILSQPPPKQSASNFARALIDEKLRLQEEVAHLESERARRDSQKADRLFRWEDIDQRLLTAKTNNLAEEMSKRVEEGRRRVAFETAQSGNSAGYASRWFDFHEQLTEERVERVYAAYCETWVQQNRTISPAFIRAVRDRAVAQTFAAVKSSVANGILMRARRIAEPYNSAAIEEWYRRMDRLAVRWNRRLEAEAVAAEYRAARSDHGLSHQGIRNAASESTLNSEDDPLSTRRCAVCDHFECYHDDSGCFLDPNGNRSRDPGILSRAGLKATGAECWCPRFMTVFSQAAKLIYDSGNADALKHGTEQAITRGDARNARRLLDRLIIKTPHATRDLDWIKVLERSIAEMESAVPSFARPGSPPKPGRISSRSEDFVNVAGTLWRNAQQKSAHTVRAEQLQEIAFSLDEKNYTPPSKYLERDCATKVKAFNSQNSNSKIGPLLSWSQLVAVGDKDHLRGMRRMLSRCAEKLSP
jgi:hypothetical protein